MTTTVSRERPHSTKEMLAVRRVFRRVPAPMPRLVQAVQGGDNIRRVNRIRACLN